MDFLVESCHPLHTIEAVANGERRYQDSPPDQAEVVGTRPFPWGGRLEARLPEPLLCWETLGKGRMMLPYWEFQRDIAQVVGVAGLVDGAVTPVPELAVIEGIDHLVQKT
ncbi:unnamed protein product [Clonostachys solani]|uniref:Uncharacterized protein n=1 Tax=Clonostachys solani TaxID=160281 RepID=A0A9N9W3C3_9HYPO|nr:unnamed protein product [Clonostachys solani]